MPNVIDNVAAGRFELIEEGQTAYADYRREGGRLYIDYVFSPVLLRGKGTSDRLMRGLQADALEKGEEIVPICGYAASWLRRHPG